MRGQSEQTLHVANGNSQMTRISVVDDVFERCKVGCGHLNLAADGLAHSAAEHGQEEWTCRGENHFVTLESGGQVMFTWAVVGVVTNERDVGEETLSIELFEPGKKLTGVLCIGKSLAFEIQSQQTQTCENPIWASIFELDSYHGHFQRPKSVLASAFLKT